MATLTTDFASVGSASNPSTTTGPSQGPQEISTCYLAQVLFGPTLYSHYLGWQSSILGYGGAQFPGPEPVRLKLFNDRRSGTLGDFPSLLHYKHFTAYMVQALPLFVFSEYFEEGQHHVSGQNPTTPFICGHRPHPGNKFRLTFMCSRCLVRHNNDTLKRIVAAHELALRSREDGINFPGLAFNLFNMIRSDQKTHWRDIVYDLEVEAKLETKWESERQGEGLNVKQAVAGTICSSEVLKEAFTNCPSMFEGWNFEFRPKLTNAPSSCRYKSILRRDVSCAGQKSSCAIAKSCLGNKCARSNARKDDTADCPSGSCSFRGSFSKEPADRSSSQVIKAPSSPRVSSIVPRVIPKQFRWAKDVVQYANRHRESYQRRSSWYQPGRWACLKRRGWAHPNGLEYELEDDGSDGESSDDEDLVASDDSDASLETQCPSSEHFETEDLLVESLRSQGPAMARRNVCKDGADIKPLADHGETSIKRRRLNCRLPTILLNGAKFDSPEPNWQEAEAEAEGEAQFRRMFGYEDTEDLTPKDDSRTIPSNIKSNDTRHRAGVHLDIKGSVPSDTDSLAAYDGTKAIRRRSNKKLADFLPGASEELSSMQKGAWDGEIQPYDRTELKEYAESLPGGNLPETAANRFNCYGDLSQKLKRILWREKPTPLEGDISRKV